ncbi:ThiF family adenylyltransferase [Saccharothrix australiensis]|uniref:ThiF family protein n=1 Tax=Saccharothrix australiensis TaxID=2072 RepID=A0A495VW00_9PSEU|nr:ThiF family adenylyltransferase [Saccharothrix australiensis]RKT53562.1 ThiF family protein [Saccharothrix australiensis]
MLDAGAPFETTFHANADGSLCLWTDDWAVDQAPWLVPDVLLDRIGGWLCKTAAGWPGDDDCDLERYLKQEHADRRLVLYDASALTIDRAVRTGPGPNPHTISITNERRRVGDLDARRKDRNLAWVADIGCITRPLRSWDDVAVALGPRAVEVRRLIAVGVVTHILFLYVRGTRQGVLVVRVRKSSDAIQVTACESADVSAATRMMRAGSAAPELSTTRIAIVGCGAIGSFAADALFRAGARRLTLVDGERLRPGNVVRHLAGNGYVGWLKTEAVRACLRAVDPDVTGIHLPWGRLDDLEEAEDLIRDHQVVLDATGSGYASSLLATAAESMGRSTGHAVVSACVQRDGDVLRVDRMPLRSGERYLPALPRLDSGTRLQERGCGSAVSPTPPGAVVAAAELAHQVVVGAALLTCELPASIAVVRRPQPEPLYNRIGTMTSDVLQDAAS